MATRKRQKSRSGVGPVDKAISVRLPSAQYEKLKRHAAEKMLPVATLARNTILEFLYTLEENRF